jgi:transposase-like protein
MPRTCTVCVHPQRHAIEKALVGGTPNRRIATQHGLSEAAVRRHADAHLPVALVQAQEAQEVAQALDVLQQLRTINGAALTVLRDARIASDGELALKAIDRILKQIELQAKLLGELDERPVVNVLISPEWLALRGRIVATLGAFPDARVALAEVLSVG